MSGCGTPPGSAPAPGPSRAPEVSKGDTTGAPSAAPAPSTPATPSCAQLAAELPLEDQVGQLFMVGKPVTEPVTDSYRQMLTSTHAGQVLLLENTTEGSQGVRRVSEELRTAMVTPSGVRPLIAADQEGGKVQRLKGPGLDTMPSAVEQARMSAEELTRRAAGWAEQLRTAGVDVDLAPVADTVPRELADSNEPIGRLRRGYGSEPAKVASSAAAFTAGMKQGGVATSAKHFPNLGRVKGNTDLQTRVSDPTTTRGDAATEPFRRSIEAGADMVMISTAIYPKIDPKNPAAFSPVVIEEMLRRDLGFDKVVISDDLGAAKQVSEVRPGDRAVRFLAAGGDVVINGDPQLQEQMHRAVRERAATDPRFGERVRTSASRVLSMKAHHRAAGCTPA